MEPRRGIPKGGASEAICARCAWLCSATRGRPEVQQAGVRDPPRGTGPWATEWRAR
jgi:hypothetical protein